MHIVKTRDKSFQLTRHKAHGRPVGRVHGGWIADLVALEKAVILCELHCYRKFDPGSVGYEEIQLVPTHNFVIGDCDGCKIISVKCRMFLKRR